MLHQTSPERPTTMDASTSPEFGEDPSPTPPQEALDSTNPLVESGPFSSDNDSVEPILQANEPTTTAFEENNEPTKIFRTENDGIGSDIDKLGSDWSSESEGNSDPSLWCSATRLSHAQLLRWKLSRCPACKQALKKPSMLHSGTQAKVPVEKSLSKLEHPAHEPQRTEAQPRSRVVYSNRFLFDSYRIAVEEPWPHALDLERDRGEASAAANVDPIVEVVTIVRTNMNDDPYTRGFNIVTTASILSDSQIATSYVGLEVVVNSRRVIEALKRIITYYPNLDLAGTSLKIDQPFAVFFHFRDEIIAYRSTYPGSIGYRSDCQQLDSSRAGFKACDEETYEHLGAMQEVIEREGMHEVKKEIGLHRQTPSSATYHMLWLLFKPGTKVYRLERGRRTAGVVLSVEMQNPIQGKADAIYIKYWNLGFDGVKLGRCEDRCFIKPFEGIRRITELEIFPCSVYDSEDSGDFKSTLINQGKQYWKLIRGSQVDYSGKLPTDNTEWHGRVIIDPRTYYTYEYGSDYVGNSQQPRSLAAPAVGQIQDSLITFGRRSDTAMREFTLSQSRIGGSPSIMGVVPPPGEKWQAEEAPRSYEAGPWAEYDNISVENTKSLELLDSTTGEKDMSRYLLCPRDVVGFDLKARQWKMFDVAYCKDAVFNLDAIKNLVMPDERKSLIESLVYRYTNPDAIDGKVPKPWTADFIKNKGEGQIFLLHGSPGVGKTYTAECIAEATRRPLLSLTCGDIGTNEVTAEQKLSKWFRLAELWGAVMLLDEADVFLEKRSMSDLQRNSLVSVFLRMIEYYRGILFLTTNRVGHFDDAFISRIHSVIHYDNFSLPDQHQIWKQFFAKLESERRKDIRIDSSAKKFVFESEEIQGIEWNGRQIRNAFQTAVAFAEYRFLKVKPEERDEGERASLEEQDFAKVCGMTAAFQRYMDSVHGGTEAKRARIEGIRNDAFRSGPQ